MIADGFPNPEVSKWKVRHVTLPSAHADVGNTPRSVGCLLADSEGYDFIANLDADNWYQPNHISSLLELHQKTKAPICCSWRTYHRPDGSMLPLEEDDASRNLQHVDSNCYFLHRSAFRMTAVWHRMPHEVNLAADRVFRMALQKQGFAFAYTNLRTVAYRTLHELSYVRAGEEPPPGFKPRDLLVPVNKYLRSFKGVTESVDRLGFWPLSDPNFFR
jgi:hypothetical protein